MIRERNIYIRALEERKMDLAGFRAAVAEIGASDIKAHGKDIPFSYIPLFIGDEDMKTFDGIICAVNGILCKMTRRYIEDEDYRKIFHFSKEMERLILLPCAYEEMIPVGRYDLFYDETSGAYSFCEFNTDGSGGMSRDFEMSAAILRRFADRECVRALNARPFDTIDRMAEEFLRIYRSDAGAVRCPTFCISDFSDEIVMSDVRRFIRAFEKRGVSCRFTDVRDFRFDGQYLYDGTDRARIHCIYRRIVTSVLLERMDECEDLLRAVEAGAVVLIGHFRTSLAHSKVVFSAMHDPMTRAFLSDAENAYIDSHIPATYRLCDGGIGEEKLELVRKEREDWILKPEEGFGSHGVVSGMDVGRKEWEKLLEESMNRGMIAQKFCPRYSVPLLGPGDEKPRLYPLMLGIYQAGGRAVGFYSRAGDAGVIDFDHGGICVSTVFCGSAR